MRDKLVANCVSLGVTAGDVAKCLGVAVALADGGGGGCLLDLMGKSGLLASGQQGQEGKQGQQGPGVARTAFKRCLLGLGFSLTDFPDEDFLGEQALDRLMSSSKVSSGRVHIRPK